MLIIFDLETKKKKAILRTIKIRQYKCKIRLHKKVMSSKVQLQGMKPLEAKNLLNNTTLRSGHSF